MKCVEDDGKGSRSHRPPRASYSLSQAPAPRAAPEKASTVEEKVTTP